MDFVVRLEHRVRGMRGGGAEKRTAAELLAQSQLGETRADTRIVAPFTCSGSDGQVRAAAPERSGAGKRTEADVLASRVQASTSPRLTATLSPTSSKPNSRASPSTCLPRSQSGTTTGSPTRSSGRSSTVRLRLSRIHSELSSSGLPVTHARSALQTTPARFSSTRRTGSRTARRTCSSPRQSGKRSTRGTLSGFRVRRECSRGCERVD